MATVYDQQYLETIKGMARAGMEIRLVVGDSLRRKTGQTAGVMPKELRADVSRLAECTLELSEFSAEQLASRSADASPTRTTTGAGHKVES
ncbi:MULTISPECIES: hypothetical protein [unclassified Marinobacter]|uniref:hypothetical protein n=1 Tax=unclassified Marinobacter TaxID=83889 RepID=UPI0018F26B5A|nr:MULTISPECIES: hypothetical protein [unclassified Marinobacter]